MADFIVKKKIILFAKPRVVWDALTNPEKTKQYFFHCKVFSDWQKGSAITFQGRIFFFKKIELKGEILAIEKEKLLKYTLRNGNSDSFSTVTDELTYVDGRTLLTIHDDVGKGEGAQKRYNRSMRAWDKVLEGLRKIVEEREVILAT